MFDYIDTYDKRKTTPTKTVRIEDGESVSNSSSSAMLSKAAGLGSSMKLSMLGRAAIGLGAAIGGVIADHANKQRKKAENAPGAEPVAGPSGLRRGDEILKQKTEKWTPDPNSNVLLDAAHKQVQKRVDVVDKTIGAVTNPEQSMENLKHIGENLKEMGQAIYGAHQIATGNVEISPGDVADVSKGAAIDVANNTKNVVAGAIKGAYAGATVSKEGIEQTAAALNDHVINEAETALAGVAISQGAATVIGAIPHPAAKVAAAAIRYLGPMAAGATFSEKMREAHDNLHGSETGKAVGKVLKNAAEADTPTSQQPSQNTQSPPAKEKESPSVREKQTAPAKAKPSPQAKDQQPPSGKAKNLPFYLESHNTRQEVLASFKKSEMTPPQKMKLGILDAYMKKTGVRLEKMERRLSRSKAPEGVILEVAEKVETIGAASHTTQVQSNMRGIHGLYGEIASVAETERDSHIREVGRLSKKGQDETRDAYVELTDIDRSYNRKPPTREELQAAARRYREHFERLKELEKAKRDMAFAQAIDAALNIVNAPAFTPEKQASLAERERLDKLEWEQREARAHSEWLARRDAYDAQVSAGRAAECARTERLREREHALQEQRLRIQARARPSHGVEPSAPVDVMENASAPPQPVAVHEGAFAQPHAVAEQAPPPYSMVEPSAPEEVAEPVAVQPSAPPAYAEAIGEEVDPIAAADDIALPAYTEEPSIGEMVLENARSPDCEASALAELNTQYEQILEQAERQLAEQMEILESGSGADLSPPEAGGVSALPELPSVEVRPELPVHEPSEPATRSRRRRALAE